MPRESKKNRTLRAGRIIKALRGEYDDAHCALHHKSALQLLAATILSAQCTDERVNKVTPELFRRFPTAADYAEAANAEMEAVVHTTGFFRNKAKSLIGLGKALVRDHGGQVPDTMEALYKLPGVGRKTANVLLGTWFNQPAIPVDTHVTRLSHKLRLAKADDPVKIEYELQELFTEEDWTFSSHALIWHGRRVCKARRPACGDCLLAPDCPSAELP
jgi:endonuclease-3